MVINVTNGLTLATDRLVGVNVDNITTYMTVKQFLARMHWLLYSPVNSVVRR